MYCVKHKLIKRRIDWKLDKIKEYQKLKVCCWDLNSNTPFFTNSYFRGSDSYIFWIRKRLEYSLNTINKLKYMLTLTVKSNKLLDCLACKFILIKKMYQGLKQSLLKIVSPCKPQYLTVIEPTQSGFPHYHIAVTGQFLNKQKLNEINDLWGYRTNYIKINKPINYIMKYILKDGQDFRYQSFLSCLKMRQYYTSSKLLVSKQYAKNKFLLQDPNALMTYIGTTEQNPLLYSNFRLGSKQMANLRLIKKGEEILASNSEYSLIATKVTL